MAGAPPLGGPSFQLPVPTGAQPLHRATSEQRWDCSIPKRTEPVASAGGKPLAKGMSHYWQDLEHEA